MVNIAFLSAFYSSNVPRREIIKMVCFFDILNRRSLLCLNFLGLLMPVWLSAVSIHYCWQQVRKYQQLEINTVVPYHGYQTPTSSPPYHGTDASGFLDWTYLPPLYLPLRRTLLFGAFYLIIIYKYKMNDFCV